MYTIALLIILIVLACGTNFTRTTIEPTVLPTVNATLEPAPTEIPLEMILTEPFIKYPEATYVWRFLKDHGFSNFVAAGIIGNMMTECGGQSLKLNPYAYNSAGYYGLCQWSPKYYPEIIGKSIEIQCLYLMETMPKQFKTYGKRYKEGFTYFDFLSLTDEQEAAEAFALCYERCGAGPYIKRRANASSAYAYFAFTGAGRP